MTLSWLLMLSQALPMLSMTLSCVLSMMCLASCQRCFPALCQWCCPASCQWRCPASCQWHCPALCQCCCPASYQRCCPGLVNDVVPYLDNEVVLHWFNDVVPSLVKDIPQVLLMTIPQDLLRTLSQLFFMRYCHNSSQRHFQNLTTTVSQYTINNSDRTTLYDNNSEQPKATCGVYLTVLHYRLPAVLYSIWSYLNDSVTSANENPSLDNIFRLFSPTLTLPCPYLIDCTVLS